MGAVWAGRTATSPRTPGRVLLPLPAEIGEVADDGTVRVGAGTSLHDLMTVLLPRRPLRARHAGHPLRHRRGAIACDVHGKTTT